MDGPLLALLVKLPLALAVFLLIVYAGTISKRIAGVLLTFPILNGVAIIASPDPVEVANAIYPLVIFNCVLFALVISYPRALAPSVLPRGARIAVRIVVWSMVWLAGAYAITAYREAIAGAWVLFAGATVFALAFMATRWTRQAAAANDNIRPNAGFVAFWATRTGAWRIVLFCAAYAALILVTRHALAEKWVGMASALPLPGFFALAALTEDTAPAGLRPIRDTVFLGPVLVIPFNFALSHLLVAMPASALRYAILLAFYAVAAAVVVMLLPRMARILDRRS
jgi:hypothetical protein